jgi:hypothetical protein
MEYYVADCFVPTAFQVLVAIGLLLTHPLIGRNILHRSKRLHEVAAMHHAPYTIHHTLYIILCTDTLYRYSVALEGLHNLHTMLGIASVDNEPTEPHKVS